MKFTKRIFKEIKKIDIFDSKYIILLNIFNKFDGRKVKTVNI